MRPTAAIITVGTELVTGLRLDTNTREIAAHLSAAGYDVIETMSAGDDIARLTAAVRRLALECRALVITGGLGPTHDDITREGVAAALELSMRPDAGLAEGLLAIASRHSDPDAASQVARQAMVIDGATVIPATSGTAPGQVIQAGACRVVLLPGPPHEMRPMLEAAFEDQSSTADPVILRCVGLSESDAQVRALRAIADTSGVTLTVLASPSLVDVILIDSGGGAEALSSASAPVREALGEACYGSGSTTLAEAVLDLARDKGASLGCAESCTGGMIASALTDVPGASDVFAGGVTAYSNSVKTQVLGVDAGLIAEEGAVSEGVAIALADSARRLLAVDFAIAVTGVAGPDGGSDEKPVGTVWFGVASPAGVTAEMRSLFGDRHGIRTRATIAALDILRRELMRGA